MNGQPMAWIRAGSKFIEANPALKNDETVSAIGRLPAPSMEATGLLLLPQEISKVKPKLSTSPLNQPL